MPHFDPTIYGCESLTIRYRISEPDATNSINGSLDIIIAGNSGPPIRIILHDTQTKEPYKRDFIKITLDGIIATPTEELASCA